MSVSLPSRSTMRLWTNGGGAPRNGSRRSGLVRKTDHPSVPVQPTGSESVPGIVATATVRRPRRSVAGANRSSEDWPAGWCDTNAWPPATGARKARAPSVPPTPSDARNVESAWRKAVRLLSGATPPASVNAGVPR